MINEAVKKALVEERQQASFCRNCLRRAKCNIKEEVALEEHMLSFGPRKYIQVTAKCSNYIYDAAMKPDGTANEDFVKSLFGKKV